MTFVEFLVHPTRVLLSLGMFLVFMVMLVAINADVDYVVLFIGWVIGYVVGTVFSWFMGWSDGYR